MKTRLLTSPWCQSLLVAGLCVSAQAGPLKRSDVANDPAWLAHLDVDRLKTSSVGQFILSELDKPENVAKVAGFEAIFGINPRTQLHGLTVYGPESGPSDGILLVYADFDKERLATLANAASGATNRAHGKHLIYSWIDENKPAKDGVKPRTYAALDGKRLFFGQREDRVAQALDVVDGTAPSLAQGKAFGTFGVGGDTNFAEAGARNFEFPGSDPNAKILRLAKVIRLEFSEANQQVRGTLSLEAENEEIVTQIVSIINGLTALMKLQTEKPEVVKFANALTAEQDGLQAKVTLRIASKDLVEVMKADAARKAAKKAQEKE